MRLALPFDLAHINVWLLRDQDGWTLVDTGLHNATTRTAWEHLFVHELEGLPLTQVIATHLHPDHVGCAGWLCDRFGVDLWMSREEYLLCRVLVEDTTHPAPSEGIRFYQQAGFPPEHLERYQDIFGSFGRMVSPLPLAYRRLQHGQELKLGQHNWKVIVGRGHSPEHACLYCEELNLLISGDQLLPTISSNVSVYPTEPTANPLKHWLASLQMLQTAVPENVLVLPAHGKPFTGAHQRAQALIEEHKTGLDKLRTMLQSPQRAVDVFPALFKSRITPGKLILATGEALAHMHYLVECGEAFCEADEHGINWFQMH